MSKRSDRRTLVEAVKTPIAFFALGLLIMEALLLGLALGLQGTNQTFLIHMMPIFLGGVIIIVALLAVFRPEALRGERHSAPDEALAGTLAVAMVDLIDGFNMRDDEKTEAYDSLQNISTSLAQEHERNIFCQALAYRVVQRLKRRTEDRQRIATYRQGITRVGPAPEE